MKPKANKKVTILLLNTTMDIVCLFSKLSCKVEHKGGMQLPKSPYLDFSSIISQIIKCDSMHYVHTYRRF